MRLILAICVLLGAVGILYWALSDNEAPKQEVVQQATPSADAPIEPDADPGEDAPTDAASSNRNVAPKAVATAAEHLFDSWFAGSDRFATRLRSMGPGGSGPDPANCGG